MARLLRNLAVLGLCLGCVESESRVEPKEAAPLEALMLVEELGDQTLDIDVAAGKLVDAAVRSDGRLVVLTSDAPALKLFDPPISDAVSSYSEVGSGPGGLIEPTAVAFSDDGSIAVSDRARQRVILFTVRDGTVDYLREVTLPGSPEDVCFAESGLLVSLVAGEDRAWIVLLPNAGGRPIAVTRYPGGALPAGHFSRMLLACDQESDTFFAAEAFTGQVHRLSAQGETPEVIHPAPRGFLGMDTATIGRRFRQSIGEAGVSTVVSMVELPDAQVLLQVSTRRRKKDELGEPTQTSFVLDPSGEWKTSFQQLPTIIAMTRAQILTLYRLSGSRVRLRSIRR